MILSLAAAVAACSKPADPARTDRDLLLEAARRTEIKADPVRVAARIAEVMSTPGLVDSLYAGLDSGGIAERIRADLDIEAYLDRMIRSRVQISDAEMEHFMADHPEEYAGKTLDEVKGRLLPYMQDEQARAAIAIHLRKLRAGDHRMTRG